MKTQRKKEKSLKSKDSPKEIKIKEQDATQNKKVKISKKENEIKKEEPANIVIQKSDKKEKQVSLPDKKASNEEAISKKPSDNGEKLSLKKLRK